MKRLLVLGVGLAALGCGGLGTPGPGKFAASVAELMATENDGVECRLGTTNGGSITFLDWKHTFGEPIVRPFPKEMEKPNKGPRQMMIVPVTLENTQPKKRSYDRRFKIHRTDGEIFDSHAVLPSWIDGAVGTPNITNDFSPYAPGESREGYAMFTVRSPEDAIGSVLRIFATEKIPGTRRHRMKDHICVEVLGTSEAPALAKP